MRLLDQDIADGFSEFGFYRPWANHRDANLAAGFLPKALGSRSSGELGARIGRCDRRYLRAGDG